MRRNVDEASECGLEQIDVRGYVRVGHAVILMLFRFTMLK